MNDIQQLFKTLKNRRVVLLGVGNTMRGDDGLGPELIKRLRNKTKAKLLDGGELPENYASAIIKHSPDCLVIIDAADLQQAPGHAAIIPENQITGTSFSSHKMPLTMLAAIIRQTLPEIKIIIIGVQPQSAQLAEAITPPVIAALNKLEQLAIENEI